VFDRGLQVMRAHGSTTARERVRSIVVVEVDEAAALISPAYDDGTPERVITERWLAHHNRLHRAD
jgi:hypothetical protein